MLDEDSGNAANELRGVSIRASIAARLNAAFHQNSVPAIAEIELINDGSADLERITLSVSSTPAFLQPKVFHFDHIRAGGTQRLNPVAVDLDAKLLLGLTEAVQGEVTIVAKAGGVEIARLVAPCSVLSPSEWTGLSTAPELVAAFVRPNDPSVDAVLRNAAEKLRMAGRDPAIDGYESRTKARAWELAEAIWAVLCDEQIVYALPPQSFERNGQKVRSPSAILERKIGTCLDLTLLFAACLEQAGLNPLIGFSEGHAFCGVWLTNDEFSLGVVDEAQTLRKRMQLDEIVLVETTLLTNQPPVRFRSAVEKAKALVSQESEKPFELLVDVRRARHRQIRPLALGAESVPHPIAVATGQIAVATLEAPPTLIEEEAITGTDEETLDRLGRWKRKLLDLSLRNKLLNFKTGKSAIALACPNPGALEDLLAAGESIKILPRADVMSGNDPREANLHFRQVGDDAAARYAAEALQRHDVHTNLDPEELDQRLTEIYRSARNSVEEGGANSLYLAVGFVSWTPQSKDQICKAPLLLVPAALERRTVRSGFRLVRHDDDPRINPTLLEMLRQDFELVIPDFDRELPVDASGLDVARIWRITQSYLKDVRGFELTEEVVLSNFSFVKYLMWKDLVDRTELLKRNPVVRHLIDTPKESYSDPSDLPDEYRLDDDIHPRNVFTPLPVDSSQLAAVVAAARGKDFVLFGPPGTGKSQTIANMIVQLLADGKSVLFVSQKTTALEVVRKRLNEIGLGSFCLEVHSAKAQKTSVLNQLKSAWESRAADTVAEWELATSDLKAVRDQLNAVVRALHRRHRNGLTVQRALGRVIAERSVFPGLILSFASLDQHDEEDMRRLRAVCRDLKTAIEAIGDPSRHALDEIRRTEWSPVWQNDLVTAATRFNAAAPALASSSENTAALFGAAGRAEPHWIYSLLVFVAQAFKTEAVRAAPLLELDNRHLREAFASWQQVRARYNEIAAGLAGTYREGIFTLDLVAILGKWHEASRAMLLVRSSRKRRAWDIIAPFADGTVPEDVGADIARLIDLRSLREKAAEYDEDFAALGPVWRGLETDPSAIEALFSWADSTRAAAERLATADQPAAFWIRALLSHLRGGLAETAESSNVRRRLAELVQAFKEYESARTELFNLAEPADEWLGQPSDGNWLRSAAAVAKGWGDAARQLQRWCAWQKAARAAEVAGLKPLIIALSAGRMSPGQIASAFELGYARWWVEQVVESEESLRVVADHHNDAIARFAEINDKVARMTRHVVASRLCGNIPSRTAFGRDPEFGTLAREIEKRARHMPLRQLFGRMPGALARLAPCMMMSPLSIAQYLPADAKPFDVVIFDEASQIPVWDAIGAIARGNQVVVVGDPKQLPPTSFFDRSDEGYDDASDLEDLESILDECLAANIPHKRLGWHYRSKHESLIAFSNERYYEGRLVTFPSPVTEDRAVRYVHVPGGVYERGSGRVNREEARAVVRDIIRRLSDNDFAARKQSLGIVTFNVEQQRLIENLLDQERRSRPALEQFFGADWQEPVFVKNLETVQGDERDIILFSVGYGADATGRVSQNFGPLNKDGGERRLNVAITRARSELVVFATLRPDQIDLSRTKATGVRDFKHFLEYAERGPRALAEAAAPLGEETESPFESAVRKALEDRGWVVHPQVGVAGFRVDLGIVFPDSPGRYLAGVECDGATYHRSATARDRDLVRERVLRDLGWRIHRVWSTDWWVDYERAIGALHAALTADLADERREETAKAVLSAAPSDLLNVEPTAEPYRDSRDISRETLVPVANTTPSEADSESVRRYAERAMNKSSEVVAGDHRATTGHRYLVVDFEAAGFRPDRGAFYEKSYRPTLRRMAAHVISVEGPIFDDLLVNRIARAHGFGRAAGRIREIVLDVVERRFPRSAEAGRKIFWPEGSDKDRFPPFRPCSLDDRDHFDIPLVELASLAQRFVSESATPDEVAAMIGRELGLARVRDSARKRFEEAARLAETRFK